MLPVQFEGAEVVGKPPSMTDEECSSIWAMRHMIPAGKDADGNDLFTAMWEQAWMPNKEDIEAIKARRPIRLFIYSTGLPPVSMFTSMRITSLILKL